MTMQNKEEYWKDVPNYEGIYQISNLGNIKSKRKLLKPILKESGYLYICLVKNRKKKQYTIHRLVAQTFIPNPNNLPQINHKDENKLNNCIDNLEWCTRKYNCNYGNRMKKIIKKLNIKILQYDLDGNFIKEWKSIKDATETLKIRNICQVLNGKRKQAGGYIWKKLKV